MVHTDTLELNRRPSSPEGGQHYPLVVLEKDGLDTSDDASEPPVIKIDGLLPRPDAASPPRIRLDSEVVDSGHDENKSAPESVSAAEELPDPESEPAIKGGYLARKVGRLATKIGLGRRSKTDESASDGWTEMSEVTGRDEDLPRWSYRPTEPIDIPDRFRRTSPHEDSIEQLEADGILATKQEHNPEAPVDMDGDPADDLESQGVLPIRSSWSARTKSVMRSLRRTREDLWDAARNLDTRIKVGYGGSLVTAAAAGFALGAAAANRDFSPVIDAMHGAAELGHEAARTLPEGGPSASNLLDIGPAPGVVEGMNSVVEHASVRIELDGSGLLRSFGETTEPASLIVDIPAEGTLWDTLSDAYGLTTGEVNRMINDPEIRTAIEQGLGDQLYGDLEINNAGDLEIPSALAEQLDTYVADNFEMNLQHSTRVS